MHIAATLTIGCIQVSYAAILREKDREATGAYVAVLNPIRQFYARTLKQNHGILFQCPS